MPFSDSWEVNENENEMRNMNGIECGKLQPANTRMYSPEFHIGEFDHLLDSWVLLKAVKLKYQLKRDRKWYENRSSPHQIGIKSICTYLHLQGACTRLCRVSIYFYEFKETYAHLNMLNILPKSFLQNKNIIFLLNGGRCCVHSSYHWNIISRWI